MANKTNSILSIDAGGIKGIYSLIILAGLSEKFRINFKNEFQQYVGTSIGSVIATALASNIKTQDIFQIFLSVKDDFNKGHTYMMERLFDSIDNLFGNKRLSELDVNLFIPVFNFSKKKMSYFSNETHPEILVAEALKAACSDIRIVKPYNLNQKGILYTDAGFFAYDPILYFIQTKNIEFNSRLKILSIGSGIIENISSDLNVGPSFDIIYDSFLQTQFDITSFFFSKIAKQSKITYQRISEFPLTNTKNITVEYLIRIAQERVHQVDSLLGLTVPAAEGYNFGL